VEYREFVTVHDLASYLSENYVLTIVGKDIEMMDMIYTIRDMGRNSYLVSEVIHWKNQLGDVVDNMESRRIVMPRGRNIGFDDKLEAITWVVKQIGGVENIDQWGEYWE
jgi:hypothetical protein